MSKNQNEDPKKQLEEAAEASEETAASAAEIEAAEETAAKKKHERTPEEDAERALNKVKRRKKLKYGTLATVITVVVVAIVVVANVISNVLDKRYNWNIDLTSSGLYEIDEQTVSYLNQLTTDIDVAVMAEETYYNTNSKFKVVQETLNRFAAESNGHITIKYIDMTQNPDAVKPYSDYYSGEFAEGDVVMKNGELVRAVSFDELIKTEQSYDYTNYQNPVVTKYSFIGEQSLLSAIMGVTDLNPITIAFLDKMNGGSTYNQNDILCYNTMQELLEKNNYKVQSLDISTDAIPEECTVAILPGPSSDLTEAQIQKLTDFLYDGGQYGKKLLYFASPYQGETKKLDEFLEVWGIGIGQDLVLEGNTASAQYVQIAVAGRGINANSVPIVTPTDAEVNKNLVASKQPLVAPYCRNVKQLFETNSGRTTKALLTTADTAFLYAPSEDENTEFDPSTAEHGTFNAAVIGTQSFSVDNVVKSSDVVAFGSAWFVDYVISGMKAYDNPNYFVGLMNSLTGKEGMITIAEKSLDMTTIQISEGAVKGIRTVVMLVFPLVIAIVGIVVYVRRRNK